MKFPITYFERNLIFNTQREAWAGFRLQPFSYDYLGHDQKIALLQRLSRLFWYLEEYEGHLAVVPSRHSIRAHFDRLAGELRGPLVETGDRYAGGVAQYLERLLGAEGHEYSYFLFLKLPRPPIQGLNFRTWLRSLWQEPRRLIEELAGVSPFEILDYELQAYLDREELAHQRLTQVVRAWRLEEGEIASLLRGGFFRGLGNPPDRPGWRPDAWVVPRPEGGVALRPARPEILTLADGELDLRHPRRIGVTQLVDGEEQTAYQAFAVLAELPDELPFPGAEWLFSLQDLPFPVEVHLRWSNLPYREALGMVRRKKLEIADQDQHTRGAGEDTPLALMGAQEQALTLEQDLKQRKFPTLLASVSFGVAAPEPRLLNERLSQLKGHLAAHQCTAEVPAGDQLRLFHEAIPGSARPAGHYIHRLPPEVVGAGMFLCTRSLGDSSGPFIGRTGALGQPVYLDPAAAPRRHRSASAAFVGTLGGGKSFTANLLTYLTAVTGGARGLILDPKGERSAWPELLPELADHLNVITLSPHPRDYGKLDPFVIFRSLGEAGRPEATNLALSLLSFLCRAQPGDDAFVAILEALAAVKDEPAPGLRRVVDYLEARAREGDKELKSLARYLRALQELPYAGLFFGAGDEETVDTGYPLNILQLQHLTLPPPGRPRADYSLEETLSVALLHAVTAFANAFTRRDREIFKVVLLDEAWALLQSGQGRNLISHLLRTGRAMNTAVYLVTQSATDLLDETIRNQLGFKFIFRSEDHAEISGALELLNLEKSDHNVFTVRGLATGEALLQDLDGRVGVVRVDPVYEHLLRAFDTRPEALAVPRGVG
ncbi:MAG TPA: ATP-binding protein [Symbiobacteriaceae bacterium]|nr:ATP-binding protein [Symbiobacteriaceae bacterium]